MDFLSFGWLTDGIAEILDKNIQSNGVSSAIEDLKKNQDSIKRVVISRQMALDINFLNTLSDVVQNNEIYVKCDSSKNEDAVFDERETEIIASNTNALSKKSKTLLFCETAKSDQPHTLEEVISASKQMDSWVKIINNAKIDDRSLTPFEKYLWAFQIATSFSYVEEKDAESHRSSRDLISIINGDKIVCVGFSTLLSTLCRRIGIPCSVIGVGTKNEKGVVQDNHQACSVYLNDETYKINGLFYSDPSWSCKSNDFPNGDLSHAILKFDEIKQLYLNEKITPILSPFTFSHLFTRAHLSDIKDPNKLSCNDFKEIEALTKNLTENASQPTKDAYITALSNLNLALNMSVEKASAIAAAEYEESVIRALLNWDLDAKDSENCFVTDAKVLHEKLATQSKQQNRDKA